MREPDRSDSPAFYDPEHPANNTAPTLPGHHYDVAILCDGGEVRYWDGWAGSKDEACDLAWASILELGFRPAEIESCKRSNTGV